MRRSSSCQRDVKSLVHLSQSTPGNLIFISTSATHGWVIPPTKTKSLGTEVWVYSILLLPPEDCDGDSKYEIMRAMVVQYQSNLQLAPSDWCLYTHCSYESLHQSGQMPIDFPDIVIQVTASDTEAQSMTSFILQPERYYRIGSKG